MGAKQLVEMTKLWQLVGLPGVKKILSVNKKIAPLIRGYISTQIISVLQQIGIFEVLSKEMLSIDELSTRFKLDIKVLTPVIEYLFSIGILESEGQKYKLSSAGTFLTIETHGLFALYTGYAPIFTNLAGMLQGRLQYGVHVKRNEELMAIGSSQIVQLLPVPCLLKWLVKYKCKSLLDIGCGAGDFLSIVGDKSNVDTLIGIDRSMEVIEVAKRRNPVTKTSKQIKYVAIDAMSPDVVKVASDYRPDAISIMFVLHEIAFHGIENVTKLLQNLRLHFPKALVMICEIGRLSASARRLSTNSGNELYLYHALSNQKILTEQEWVSIFKASGYSVKEKIALGVMSQLYFVLQPN